MWGRQLKCCTAVCMSMNDHESAEYQAGNCANTEFADNEDKITHNSIIQGLGSGTQWL